MASSKKPRSSELLQRLDSFLQHAGVGGKTLTLGFSGGLDSCALLHALTRARVRHGFALQALHVHHGLSPHADAWLAFCAETCAAWNVPFVAVRVRVPRDSGLGLEAAARGERYRVFSQHEGDALVLAHHRDDQAETLLLQLLRGAGLKGLAAMPAIGALENGKPVLRPLLDVSRQELEAYAHAHGLQWIEDESNLDLAYDRNFLRHHVFPELEKRFPASRTTLARAASHLAEAGRLLDEVAAEDALGRAVQGRLAIEALRRLSEPRGKNLLRYWLETQGEAAPNARRLQELYRQLLSAREDAQMRIELERGAVMRYRGEACYVRSVEISPAQSVRWQGEPELHWGAGSLVFLPASGQGLAVERLPGGLEIHGRRGGERLRLHPHRPTRDLRLLLQEAGMPPWERERLPLIYAGDMLVAVPGIGVAAEMQAIPGEPGLVIEWRPA